MILWILGFAAIGAVVYFLLLPEKKIDWDKSDEQRLHLPPKEVNKLSNGEDGYFSRPHAYRNFAIMVGGLTVGGAVTQFVWPGALFTIAGFFAIYKFLIKSKTRQDLEIRDRNKTEQFEFLSGVAHDPSYAERKVRWETIRLESAGDERFFIYESFWDIRVPLEGGMDDPAERQRAAGELIKRFIEIAKNPAIWWDPARANVKAAQ